MNVCVYVCVCEISPRDGLTQGWANFLTRGPHWVLTLGRRPEQKHGWSVCVNVAMLTLLLVKERRGEQENPPLFGLRGPDRTAERAGSGLRAIVCPQLD